jgi:hypothetical protein
MDELSAAGFDSVDLVAWGNPPDIQATFTIRDNPTIVTYVIRDEINLNGAPVLGQKNIIVDVSWTETNRVRRVVYSTNVSPNS